MSSDRSVLTVFTVSFNELLIGNLASTHNAPSFNCGRNSVPIQRVDNSVATSIRPAIARLAFLWRNVQLKASDTFRLMNSTNELCFSETFLFNKIELITGTNVSVN